MTLLFYVKKVSGHGCVKIKHSALPHHRLFPPSIFRKLQAEEAALLRSGDSYVRVSPNTWPTIIPNKYREFMQPRETKEVIKLTRRQEQPDDRATANLFTQMANPGSLRISASIFCSCSQVTNINDTRRKTSLLPIELLRFIVPYTAEPPRNNHRAHII